MLLSARNFVHHLCRDAPDRWYPLLGVYYLTYACDFRCPHCSDGAGNPYPTLRSPVLSAERVAELLRIIRRYCDYLVLTGGEPLLHPEFAQVMADLPRLKFRGVILTTNGYALATALPAVAKAVRHLVVSLQTLDSAKADVWYGRGSGTHQQILDHIAQAARLPDRRFDMIISSVVTPENIEDLYRVYAFACRHGLRLAACPQLVGVKAHAALVDNPTYRKFYDFLIAEKRKGANIQGTVDYLEHMRDLRKFRCHPFTMLVVSPTGDVFYPCLELGQPAGNLLEEANLHRLRQAGCERYGPQPECDTRCHSACALGFSRVLEHPASLLDEVWLQARAWFSNGRPAPPAASSGSNRPG